MRLGNTLPLVRPLTHVLRPVHENPKPSLLGVWTGVVTDHQRTLEISESPTLNVCHEEIIKGRHLLIYNLVQSPPSPAVGKWGTGEPRTQEQALDPS